VPRFPPKPGLCAVQLFVVRCNALNRMFVFGKPPPSLAPAVYQWQPRQSAQRVDEITPSILHRTAHRYPSAPPGRRSHAAARQIFGHPCQPHVIRSHHYRNDRHGQAKLPTTLCLPVDQTPVPFSALSILFGLRRVIERVFNVVKSA
jgi:hypothetical protein